MPQNHIDRIRRDSRGYLWICTGEGLARFDGYGFVNYTKAHGLPTTVINDFLETKRGEYWVATDDGLCLFDPRGKAAPSSSKQSSAPMFTVFHLGSSEAANRVNYLLEDPDGSIWLATAGGLFRLQQAHGQARIEEIELGFPQGILERHNERHVVKVYFDSHGVMWAPAISGLYRRPRGGAWERYGTENGLPANFVQSFYEDRRGRFWIGSRTHGLFLLVPNPQPGQNVLEKKYGPENGLPGRDVRSISPLPDGRAWLCLSNCLVLFDPEANDDRKFQSYTTAQGLASNEIYNSIHDVEGNLWLGTRNNGVMRIANTGIVTFGPADGYIPGVYNSIAESREGEILIYNGSDIAQRYFLYRKNRGFSRAEHPVANRFDNGSQQCLLQDHLGDWWVAADRVLLRYAPVKTVADLARARPKAIYGAREGLIKVEKIFEDRQGDIWIGAGGIPQTKAYLYRWERATNKIRKYASPADRPPAIGQDAAGDLWIGNLGRAGVARYRDGKFKYYDLAAGAPQGLVHGFFLDRKKRFWFATSSGLSRLDEVMESGMRLTTWDGGRGFTTNEVFSIAEDQWGRIYAGTGRGVERLDPETGVIRHFDAADGIARGEVRLAFRDHDNHLWFVTEQGVSQMIPHPEASPAAAPVWLTAIRINGNPMAISEFGETKIEGLSLAADRNSVQMEFLSPDFSLASKLRYQYQLNGHEWSVPSESRTVNFANLAPGAYRFSVRALHASGQPSDPPATVAFSIAPPFWQRWWVLALAALTIGLLVYVMLRYRFEQRLAVERVRMRLATDLHDDIGASLSEVAVLSEVVNRRVLEHLPVAEPLAHIGEVSRDMLDAMNDIVWANNPRYDRLNDLVQRLRHFAVQLLEARGIEFRLALPDQSADLHLNGEMRQQVFLIGKEAINNLARHSGARRAEIELRTDDGCLLLRVSDDGRGFAPANADGGNGLRSMRSRAADIGGELTIASQPESGTELTLRAPLPQGRTGSHLFRWGDRRRP